jgi:hypothetical protein
MGDLLTLLNRIKAEANVDFLTPSQQEAFKQIEQFWRLPERVNLWGSVGCGKTVLGWVIARSLGAVFYGSFQSFVERYTPENVPVIIDNMPCDQPALRTALAEMQLRNVRSALIISRETNRLGFPSIAIPPPTRSDIDVVYRNLSLMEHYALTPLSDGNLWRVVYSAL